MYITDLSCISAQQTYAEAFFDEDCRVIQGNRYYATEPPYGALIPSGLLRRMGKAVRMGIGTGLPLIQKFNVDGIILATGNGGSADCLKFLNQLVEYEEGTLTPTHFVQSTSNAVAGNLALLSKTTGYNNTHVHHGLAFECAVLDAMLLLKEGNAKRVLLGSVDEISDYNYNIDFLAGTFKAENVNSENLLSKNTPGTVCGEAATMFIVEEERSEHTLACLKDVEQASYMTPAELSVRLNFFLQRNGLTTADIEGVILGLNGDNRHEHFYTSLQNEIFSHSNFYSYKNLTGDFATSSAFATWLSVHILRGKTVPAQCTVQVNSGIVPRTILIYNHFKGIQHSFMLVQA